MRIRILARAFLAITTAGLLTFVAGHVSAQDSPESKNPAESKARAAASAKGWTPPKTSWGDPDLQGIWDSTQNSLTPLERPVAMGTRLNLTDEEYAKRVAELKGRVGGAANEIWYEPVKGTVSRHTSLIIDPPDGRIPYTPEGKKRVAAALADERRRMPQPETAADLPLWERCFTRGLPQAWIPMAYNNLRQILQTPKYVMILYEEIHDARMVPLDGRPHVGPAIRSWMGDSRGHWEGNTLVVEITNFRDKMSAGGDFPVSDRARMVERFTRVNADTIDYQATVEDPATFARPWTIDIPMTKDPSQTQILEYACQEGNYNTVTLALAGARATEAKAGNKADEKTDKRTAGSEPTE